MLISDPDFRKFRILDPRFSEISDFGSQIFDNSGFWIPDFRIFRILDPRFSEISDFGVQIFRISGFWIRVGLRPALAFSSSLGSRFSEISEFWIPDPETRANPDFREFRILELETRANLI